MTADEPYAVTNEEDQNPIGTGRVLFSIRDMLVLTTVTAVIVVISPTMPFLVEGISVNAWNLTVWINLVVVFLIARYRGSRRLDVLARAGERVTCGSLRDLMWQGRLNTVVWLQLVFGALLMMSMSIWVGLAFSGNHGSFVFMTPMFIPVLVALQMLVMGVWFLSSAVFSLFWRTYPGQVEFYERGVCMNGHRFYTWDEIEQLVPSVVYKSCVAVTFRPLSFFGKRRGHFHTLIVRTPKEKIQSLTELAQLKFSGRQQPNPFA